VHGWFRFHRKLLDDPLWTNEPFTRGQAWIDLVALAAHTNTYILVRGNRLDLRRGQVGWSEVALAHRWRWSRGKVRRFLLELEKQEQIVQQKTYLSSVVTVVNYDLYQGNDTADGQQMDSKWTENGTADGTADSTADGQVPSRVTPGMTTGYEHGPRETDGRRTENGQQTVQQTDSRRYSRRYTNKNDKNDKNNNITLSASADSSPKRSQKRTARTYRIHFDYATNQFTGITDKDWATWAEAFPAVDVRLEAKRAAIWLRDNPTKRKKNVQAFLSRWFGRCQERGGNQAAKNNFKATLERWAKRHEAEENDIQ